MPCHLWCFEYFEFVTQFILNVRFLIKISEVSTNLHIEAMIECWRSTSSLLNLCKSPKHIQSSEKHVVFVIFSIIMVMNWTRHHTFCLLVDRCKAGVHWVQSVAHTLLLSSPFRCASTSSTYPCQSVRKFISNTFWSPSPTSSLWPAVLALLLGLLFEGKESLPFSTSHTSASVYTCI